MNNKYLSGLLAGVLTAGIVQGSDGKENMPGVDDKQTPVAQSSGLESEDKDSQNKTPKKKQLDSYSMLQVAQYMDTESIKTVQEVNSKFTKEPFTGEIQDHGKLINQLKKNSSPITAQNHNLYSNIETQQIFGPNDYILQNVTKYIITYPVTKEEIGKWIVKIEDKCGDMGTNEKQIVVNCQKIKKEINNSFNLDLDQRLQRFVEIKERKCFDQIVIRGTYDSVFNSVNKALADNVIFEEIVLRSFDFNSIDSAFTALKKENVYTLKLDYSGWRGIPSNLVTFYIGYSKIADIPSIRQGIDCEKDLFVFSKTLGMDKHTSSISFNNKGNCDTLEFYAPFLEKTNKFHFRKHSKMYCPCLVKIEISSDYGEPEVLYVSPDFDISQLPEGWKGFVKRYTPEQMQKIEMAKEELLAYIAINPELSNASLNCPRPDSVSQEKWDELIHLKNKLMALLRGDSLQRITVLQME